MTSSEVEVYPSHSVLKGGTGETTPSLLTTGSKKVSLRHSLGPVPTFRHPRIQITPDTVGHSVEPSLYPSPPYILLQLKVSGLKDCFFSLCFSF